jgi:ATP-dependent DNA helicase DinG
MAVSATHAALRLAQGAGRLVRRGDDRGVVAFLDSRMMTARYAGFLQRSLPPFWPTTDTAMVLAALKRLDETAGEPLPVHEPALRGTGAAGGGADGGGGGYGGVDARPVAGAPPSAASPRTAVTNGRAWTRDEDTELKEGVDLGLSLEELAAHLELPAELVQFRLSLLRLEVSAGAKMSFD